MGARAPHARSRPRRALASSTAAALLVLLGACDRSAPPSPAGSTPPAVTASSSPISGNAADALRDSLHTFVRGGSREALVAYLRNVRETPARRFDVQWHPDVVAIDRATAIATLHAVSADGVEFRFAADGGPSVRALVPGRILFLWGIALRRVTAAVQQGEEWIVSTAPVSLPEAFREADIDFDAPLDARLAFAAVHVSSAPRTARVEPGERSALRYASLRDEAGARRAAQGLRTVGWLADARAEGAAGPTIIELPNSYATSVNGIDIEMAYRPVEGGLHFEIEARKQQSDVKASTDSNPRRDLEKAAADARQRDVEGLRRNVPEQDAQTRGQADAKARDAADDWKRTGKDPNAPTRALAQGLFGVGSDLWDLRLRATGDLTGISAADSLAISNQLQIHGGALGLLHTEFRNVSGTLRFDFIARRGEHSEQWIEKLKLDIPIRFNVPIIVAGLPMVYQIGFNVILQPALTTKNDTFRASYELPFSGNGSVSLAGSKFTVGGTLATDPHPLQKLASSIGVSAILVGLQAPRIGVGIGLFGASSVVYLDLVSSATITSGGALGLAPCRQYQLIGSINAGVDTQVAFDLPGWTKFLSERAAEQMKKAGEAASLREQVFRKEWYLVEPDIPLCRTKGAGG